VLFESLLWIVCYLGLVSTYAGSPFASVLADGTLTSASFKAPMGLAVASNGVVFVSDQDGHTIRVITTAGTAIYVGLYECVC
jgi:hypothetical protein